MKRSTLLGIAVAFTLCFGVTAVGATDTDVIKKGATIELVKEYSTLIAPSVIEAAPIMVVEPDVFGEPIVVGEELVVGNYETFDPLLRKPPKNSATPFLIKTNSKLRRVPLQNKHLTIRPDI